MTFISLEESNFNAPNKRQKNGSTECKIIFQYRHQQQFRRDVFQIPKLQAIPQLCHPCYENTLRKRVNLPEFANRLNYDQKYISNKAVQQLGYTITSFEEGMSKTIQYYQSLN